MNPYEENNRRIKAEKLADVIAPHLERIGSAGFSPESFLGPDQAFARRIVEQEAGVNPGSEATWWLVVEMLKAREVAAAFQRAKENLS